MKKKLNISGVPETMLWPLHCRVSEIRRPDACIKDPKALEIYESIDFDYEKSFGKGHPAFAIRALVYDNVMREFIKEHPDGVIVNLGEGVETHRYRIDAPEITWVTVDLPESIETRELFIPADERHWHIAQSAFDLSWCDKIPKDKNVLISAQGILMYFPEEVLEPFFKGLAERFPGTSMVFCYITPKMSAKAMSKKGWKPADSWKTPPMPWGIYRDDVAPTLSRWIGKKIEMRSLPFVYPRGTIKYLAKIFYGVDFLAKRLPGSCVIKFPE